MIRPVIARLVDIDLQPLIRGETPPARLEYLTALNERLLGLACTPYAVTALLGDYRVKRASWDGDSGGRWLVAQRIACGARSMRPRLTVAAEGGSGGESAPASIYSESSGGTASDEILIASTVGGGRALTQMTLGGVVLAVDGADSWEPAPAAAQDRLVELTPRLAPATERFELEEIEGFAGEVRLVPDLSVI